MKLAQRQSQKMTLKQVPMMTSILKLREGLFSATTSQLEEFLREFSEENPYISTSEENYPVDLLFFPRIRSSLQRGQMQPLTEDVNRSLSQIIEETTLTTSSLQETLREQLHWERLSPEEIQWGELLISGLDENGFWIIDKSTGFNFLEMEMRRNPQNLPLLNKLVKVIQQLDPAGAATKNRFESAAVIVANDPSYPPEAKEFYAQIFAFTEEGMDWNLIPHRLRELWDDETFNAISSLPVPPLPGGDFHSEALELSDIIVTYRKAEGFKVSVPAEGLLSRLIFLPSFEGRAATTDNNFLLAETVLNGVAERCRLLKATAEEVLQIHREQILSGEPLWKRITQCEVAKKIHCDPPKLSRLLKNKLMEIKIFKDDKKASSFRLSLNSFFIRNGVDGHSRTEILQTMAQIEAQYGKLSDTQMSQLLSQRGIDIHRRTVCKYRSQIKSHHTGGIYGKINSRDSL